MLIPIGLAELATYLVIAITAACYCVVAIWAVTSRRHWLVRTIVPLLALAILLPIQAHEPLIYLAMVMGEIGGLILAGCGVLKLWKARPTMAKSVAATPERRPAALLTYFPTFARAATDALRNDDRQALPPLSRSIRFGLADLMLAVVPVAIAAWIASQVGAVNLLMAWPAALYASLWLAVIAVLAWQVIVSPWRWLVAVLLVLAVARAAYVDAELGDWLFTGETFGAKKSPPGNNAALVSMIVLYAATAICLIFGLALLALFRSERRRTALHLLAGGGLLVPIIVLSFVYWQMLGAVEIPTTPPLPENIYPQVLVLAEQMEKTDSRQVNVIQKELLELLDRPGHVEVDWSNVSKDPYYAYGPSGISVYRPLARSLQLHAENFHAAGKHDEAARYELAILKLGAMHLRGGLVIHALVGIAVEGVGTHLLAKHRTDYSPQVRRQIIVELMELEQTREPAEVTIARDRAFETLAWRWRTRLQWAIDRLVSGGLAQKLPGFQHHRAALLRHEADEQIVLAELAISLFRDSHGRWPATLEELVPDYLPEVPRDLHGSGPLIYRVTDNGYVLYSVSHDGRDDGGKFGTRLQSLGAGYDLNIDTIAK